MALWFWYSLWLCMFCTGLLYVFVSFRSRWAEFVFISDEPPVCYDLALGCKLKISTTKPNQCKQGDKHNQQSGARYTQPRAVAEPEGHHRYTKHINTMKIVSNPPCWCSMMKEEKKEEKVFWGKSPRWYFWPIREQLARTWHLFTTFGPLLKVTL